MRGMLLNYVIFLRCIDTIVKSYRAIRARASARYRINQQYPPKKARLLNQRWLSKRGATHFVPPKGLWERTTTRQKSKVYFTAASSASGEESWESGESGESAENVGSGKQWFTRTGLGVWWICERNKVHQEQTGQETALFNHKRRLPKSRGQYPKSQSVAQPMFTVWNEVGLSNSL